MVFCKECKSKVDLCPHFVDPIEAPKVNVFDAKIETLAYSEPEQILEIAFKTGYVWQLFGVPPSIYNELRDTTLYSFLTFIARRYKIAPVKTGLKAIKVPESEKCLMCENATMMVRHRIDNQYDINVRILWECPACHNTEWKQYGNGIERERKKRWH